jgi:UDP-N-acetylglucosamine 1-carboxyvinyltransferase
MASSASKIGQLISEVRQQRGLTQAEFAQQLNTSQSAVNRIEKGNQNVSLEMLGRISEVLNKQIVKIGGESVSFKVEGGRELSGEITTKVSKNATVAIMCAALLNKGTSRIVKAPKIEEVFRIIEVFESIGVKIKWSNNEKDLDITPPAHFDMKNINAEAARKTRTVIMMMGPIMHEMNEFNIPYAGGCKLGERTIRPHLYALERFGLKVESREEEYHVTANVKLPDSPVILAEMGETPTEHVIIAAARVEGVTEIRYASHNYMVRDLCYFLQDMGVKIEGIGTNTLRVHGKKNIKTNFSYAPAEDPIETMAFLSIAAVTNSEFMIKRCPIDFLELELFKLEKMGCSYKISEVYKAENGRSDLVDITPLKHGTLVAPEDKIHALTYPGINMDNLPFFVPIAAIAEGTTLIHDWSYENRAIYFTELNRLGATISLADPHRVFIDGPSKLKANDMVCPPALRPAVIVLIAMLAAEGTSILRNVYSINRGYEDLAKRLNTIGAKITPLNKI